MGTAKRERQKANRQLRLEELAKQARQQKAKRTGLRVGIVIAVVVAIVAAVNLLGGDDETSAPPVTTAEPTTTVPACVPADSSTFQPIPAPEKPTVTLPAAAPTELNVTVLTEGTGPGAQACDYVRVYYVGVLTADGTEFDTNYDSDTTFDLVLGEGRVIEGWDQGLIGVQAGGRYQLDIPADLAYGDQANGQIPAGSALTFVVDIVAVVQAPANATTTSTTPTTGSSVPSTGSTVTPASSVPPTTA